MEQRQWITRAMDGDRTAKAHLFEETIQNVYYLCLKLTGSAAQAGELTRRTYARAFSHLTELRPDAGFDRWVTAIAVNLCRQTMKKAQSWLFSTDEREKAILNDTYVADEECLPPEAASDPDVRVQAMRTIALLPPEQRVAMVLRYAALMKPHQIAKVMEVDEITVLGRLNCGRRALMTALPSPEPQALVADLFADEAAATTVPEVLRESCMQTVMNAQPESAAPPTPEPPAEAEDEDAPEETGFLSKLTKKQKTALFGGIGAALALLVLILALALRGCGKEEAPKPAPEPQQQSAPVEEIDDNLEAAEQLREYGVEMLLTCSRREADKLMDSWRTVLPDYVSGGDLDDLDLKISTANDAVTEVRLRLDKTDLDITRLKDLGLGSEPEIEAAGAAISSNYGLHCYRHTPLFDPRPLQTSSLGAYSENYRYELLDENGDGRAEAMSITRADASYDPAAGVFHPYGDSLTDLLGKTKAEAEALFGQGGYEGDGVDVYAMEVAGATADDANAVVSAIAQARTDMDAAHQNINALTLRVSGCFAELLPELQMPDSALTLDQLGRKLESMRGKVGLAEGDVFSSLVYDDDQSFLVYYEGKLRYFFCADGSDERISRVEVLDLSDCKLWDASSLSFRRDGFDLADLLGLDPYAAYEKYGIRSYGRNNFTESALGLWEEDDVIATIYNAADPRAMWGIRLGDSRESIEAKIEKENGYLTSEEEADVRYVIPGSRELAVTYRDGAAAILKLEDHSRESGYQPPEPKRKSAQELFGAFLQDLSDVKTSWFGDLNRDGEGDLLVCRDSGGSCLCQLYVVRDGAVAPTPVYTQSLSPADSTDLYVLRRDEGPALLIYTLSEGTASSKCSWRLVSINDAGGEVVLDQAEASANLIDMLIGSNEEFDAAKEKADEYREEGAFLCGTQSGSAQFADMRADLSE